MRLGIVMAFLLAMSPMASADGTNTTKQIVPKVTKTEKKNTEGKANPCPETPKKKKPRKKAPKAKQCPVPTTTTVVVNCGECKQGEQGARGPRGPRGFQGEPGGGGLSPEIGYMGLVAWPTKDYAWSQGPSIRLASTLTPGKYFMLLQIGFAPGRDGAIMGQLAVQRLLSVLPGDILFGVQGGVFGQVIGLDSDRANGFYMGVSPQIVLTKWVGRLGVSLEVGPAVGFANYDDDDMDFVAGFLGSAGLAWQW